MLSQPAPARPPPDGRDEDHERGQLENEVSNFLRQITCFDKREVLCIDLIKYGVPVDE